MIGNLLGMVAPYRGQLAAINGIPWPGRHSGVVTAVKTSRPAPQPAAVMAIHRAAWGTCRRSSIHWATPMTRSTNAPPAVNASATTQAGQADHVPWKVLGSMPTNHAAAAANAVAVTHRRSSSPMSRYRSTRAWDHPRTAPSAPSTSSTRLST